MRRYPGESNRRQAVHTAYGGAHSLRTGFYQGWDLHPAQLVTRYAAVFAFFLEGLESVSLAANAVTARSIVSLCRCRS